MGEKHHADGKGGSVTNAGRDVLPCLEITFDNGETITVSRNHQFLFNHRASAVEWIKAEDLKIGHKIPKYCEPYEMDNRRDAGWLAGFFDGEGYVGNYGLGANQLPGAIFEKLVSLINYRKDEEWTVSRKWQGTSKVHGIWLKGGVNDRIKFLSQIRPERIVKNFVDKLTTKNTLFQRYTTLTVADIVDVGSQEVVTLGTSTKTFIGEGFACHNSYGYWDGTRNQNCFMFLADVALGKYHIPRYGNSLPHGYDSLWAKSGQSGVINDEIIIPRSDQCNLRYLVEFN